MNLSRKIILHDCRKRDDIPADWQMYMADEIQYLDSQSAPKSELTLETGERIAAILAFGQHTRILAGSCRALRYLEEIKAEVKTWPKELKIMQHEKDWLSHLKLAF